MAVTIEVQVRKVLDWPPECACCGGAVETRTRVEHYVQRGHLRDGATWEVPSCSHCRSHYRKIVKPDWSTALSTYFWFCFCLCFVAFTVARAYAIGGGFGAVVAFVLAAGGLIFLADRRFTKAREEAKALLREHCTGEVFVRGKKFDAKVQGNLIETFNIFLFTNDQYAIRFAERNGGQKVPNPAPSFWWPTSS